MTVKLPIQPWAAFLLGVIFLTSCSEDLTVNPPDQPLVGFSSERDAVTFSPGDIEDGVVTFSISLTEPSTTDVTATLSISELSSATDSEFTLNESSITIPRGSVSATTSITAFVDAIQQEKDGVSLNVILTITDVTGDAGINQEANLKTVEIASIIPSIFYVDFSADNLAANASNTWSGAFQLQGGNDDSWYGLFYQGSSLPAGEVFRLKLESFGKAVTGTRDGDDLFVAILNEGDAINSDTEFAVQANSWPDLPTISSADFSDWNGNTAFIGIRFADSNFPGLTNYGWLRVQVNETGDQVSLIDAAYRLGGILAGSTE